MTKRERQQVVFAEILTERRRQDREWGGVKHDDNHSAWDFAGYIGKQLDKMHQSTDIEGPHRRLVKIAALAVAALEMLSREETP